ncbi:ROK family transcriptional regulator [Bacillus solitudinis]|uniref:ROK family transcriptional regulator n=1 Tax=Bacillus solitudinis TaxID=2014074 RepID=UPI000C24861D|nr:ROK family transcriptional regulator [Bacillus solitudinis]
MLRDFLSNQTKRNQSKKSLYQLIHREGPISKVELLKLFTVPQTTLTRMITELEGNGWLCSGEIGQPNGGRPPILYKVEANAGHLIGIEIARIHVQVLLLDLEFKVIDRERFFLTLDHTPEITIPLILSDMRKLLQRNCLSVEGIIGVGIGAVGPLNREKGLIINPESFLAKGWNDVDIVSEINKEFAVPIVLNNGGNTAAIAEYHAQSFTKENLLYSISGYGIRCGYIQAGTSLNSRQGDASSYGHMIVNPEGRLCSCGKKGCLNAYSSFGAMFERISERNCSVVVKSTDQLIEALHQKNQVVVDVVYEAAYYYGLAVANMMNLLHPDLVILQGKLIEESESFFNKVTEVAMKYKYSNSIHVTSIQKGYLGRDATAIGAGIEVFNSLFD